MKPCDVQGMLNGHYDDPCFFADFYNIGRGFVGKLENNGCYINRTKKLTCWRIIDNKLQQVNGVVGILFDAETYLIQWTFEYIADDTSYEDTIFYYWKGNNASKGFSPLPAEVEDQNTVVERICQWSEPALFFHMFSKCIIVFSCKREEFSPGVKRLFIVRGELDNEIHLYEVPCLKANLRSRAIFVLIEPNQNRIHYWFGASVTPELSHLFRRKVDLNGCYDSWAQFKIVEVNEGQDDIFLDMLGSECGDHVSIKNSVSFTPRLFYFNSITGDFLATEVEYPLRSEKHVAPFPFLQSHLYTATQPALFLLDNDAEIWLWRGWKEPESDLKLFKIEEELAKKTAINYAKEKEKSKGSAICNKYIKAGLEPLDFINLFPFWNKRDDIADLQIKEGYNSSVTLIKE